MCTCSPTLKSNMSARVFTESSSAPLVSRSRDSFSPTRWASGSGGSLAFDNSLKKESFYSELEYLSNHLGGLSSSVTGEMGTFCWVATDCLRRGNHLKVLASEATMMIIIICRCAMIDAWLVSLPAVDREVAEVFKDEVGFTRSFSKEIHRRIRHWRFDEC